MSKILRTLGLFLLALSLWSPGQAAADPGKAQSGKGRHKYETVKQKEKYDARKGTYEYEYESGDCKYKVKSGPKGYKEKRKCKGRARNAGGPPPWAPAHGYRRKHGGGYDRGYVREYDRGYDGAYVAPFDIAVGGCNRSELGAVLGGVTGAAIGSQIGKGDGRTAAMIGGTIIGMLVGGNIGRSMDEVDQNCVGQTLEHAPDGQAIVWNAPQDGSRYQVTPVGTYQETDGRYCREYQATSVVSGRQQRSYGTACRQPDGSWRLID